MSAPNYQDLAAEALGELARAILLRDATLVSQWWARWEVGSEDAAQAAQAASEGDWSGAERLYSGTGGTEGVAEMAAALEAFSWRTDHI